MLEITMWRILIGLRYVYVLVYWHKFWNKEILKLVLVFYFTFDSINNYRIKYIRLYVWVIEWFMDNYMLMIWKLSLVFYLKVNVSSFMQGLWKDTRKSNHNFRRVRKITKFEYLLRYVCLSDCNNSESTRRSVIKCNIWIFLKNMCRKFKLLCNLTSISGIL
jgi:hypothetical protein